MLTATTVLAQTTRTWTGGTGGTGTDIGTAANWGGTLPNAANGDPAQWDGQVAGTLALTYTAGNLAGNSGNPGINLALTANQTGSVTVTAANSGGIRMNGLSIASGAGALTLKGNGTSTALLLTLG